jgi:lysophospholipase L1-like esterase
MKKEKRMRYRNALLAAWMALLIAGAAMAGAATTGDAVLVDAMDQAAQWSTGPVKGTPPATAAPCEGRDGRPAAALAVQVSVGKLSAVVSHALQPDATWNEYDGLSFWVKGDGSENWANIRLQGGDSSRLWVASFPLRQTQWHEVRVAWGDFVPTTMLADELGAVEGARPGNVTRIGFGKEWNFNLVHKSPEIAFSIDDISLIRGVKSGRRTIPIRQFPPLATVIRKLEAGQPVTILTLGDSITWGTSAGGNQNAYPAVLAKLLQEHYRDAQITLVNRAIGGSTTSRGREWLMRDVQGIEADLITVMMGYNDRKVAATDPTNATPRYIASLVRYVEEVAGTMKAPPACLVLAPTPGRQVNWEALDAYAQGVRELVKNHPNLTLVDANAHMKQLGQEAYAPLMADEAHPNPEGQKVMAGLLFRAITGQK